MPSLFNWSRVMDETIDIPMDVTFKIVEDGIVAEVKAHKMVLGMVSRVFKTMFFITSIGDKSAMEIPVKNTTKPAFQIMIDAVYNKISIEDSLKEKSVYEIFAVLDLANRFEIPELLQAVVNHLTTLTVTEHILKGKLVNEILPVLELANRYEIPEIMQAFITYLAEYGLTEDTILDMAAGAREYRNLFKDEARILLLACAKFLKINYMDVKAIFRFVTENEAEEAQTVISELFSLMKEPDIAHTKCLNCRKKPCTEWCMWWCQK